MRLIRTLIAVPVLLAFGHGSLNAQEAPDRVFINGKIVTVDDYFSIHEAVAVRGERFLATGSSEEMQALADAETVVTDLGGRTVIPGLIDNHNHVIRATEYWPNEARLDGVTSRAEALEILRAKGEELPEGVWLMSLGGWSEAQFLDSQEDFTLAELDALAPDRPAFIQALYSHAYVNTAWFEAMGIPLDASVDERAGAEGLAARVVRDADGRATGRLNGGFPMVEEALRYFPPVSPDAQVDAVKIAFRHLNSIGLTAVYDPAGVGIRREGYARIREIAADGELTLRVYHTLGGSTPRTPRDARDLIAEIEASKPFQGDDFVDLIAVGEIYYVPFHWDGTIDATDPGEEDIDWAREILLTSARGGWSVQTHAVQPATIDHLLNLVEEVNAVHPVRPLRWTITHADNITAGQLDRVRQLGMNVQLRSNPVMGERGPVFEHFGDAAYHMPPLRTAQDSGVSYGLGTDGTKAAQIDPFVTLWWAVTGKALNGEVIQHQTLTREEALIATTRANAHLMFMEHDIGAIKPGLLADMVVLDRDYLTVPEDEIKDIRPVATMVGGRIVYGEL